MTAGSAGRSRQPLPRLYRWSCPICGRSKSRFVPGGTDDRQVANDLASHVRATEGDGHGPGGSFPDRSIQEVLREHVEPHEQ